jgi:uncharacterized protein DUF5670
VEEAHLLHHVRYAQWEAMLMLMVLVIALLILWALGAFAFKVAGGLIHLLLVVAVVVLIYRFVSGRRPV